MYIYLRYNYPTYFTNITLNFDFFTNITLNFDFFYLFIHLFISKIS